MGDEKPEKCNYPMCNSSVVTTCRFCGGAYCSKHATPGIARFGPREFTKQEQEELAQMGHPCVEFTRQQETDRKAQKIINDALFGARLGTRSFKEEIEWNLRGLSSEERAEVEPKVWAIAKKYPDPPKRPGTPPKESYRYSPPSILTRFKNWAFGKPRSSWIDKERVFSNLVIFAVCSLLALFLYSEMDKINQIKFWFIPLGTVLLLVVLYYWARYAIALAKQARTLYLSQQNIIRSLLLLLLLFVVWQCYTNRETISSETVNIYNQINFTRVIPFQLNGSMVTTHDGQTYDLPILTPVNMTEKTRDIELTIFVETNNQRTENGLSPLKLDDQLSSIARAHSADMAQNNFFSHTNLQGEDPTARAIRAGYNVNKYLGAGWYSNGIGENIDKMPTGNVEGMGYVSNDAKSVAKAVVESWMESPGHRENILNSQYDTIGVGVAYDGTYYLCTQDFQ